MSGYPHQIGPYELLDTLGRGGMGVVYRARHQATGALVALKTVEVPRAQMLQGIRREIAGLGRLRHRGIVRILDEGVGQGVPWYAMELLEGLPLRQWMGSQPAVDPAAGAPPRQPWWTATLSGTGSGTGEFGAVSTRSGPKAAEAAAVAETRPAAEIYGLGAVLSLFRRLCWPLAYLHGQGMVHRDLKPENVLLTGSPEPGLWPVIVDFGVAMDLAGALGRESLALDAAPAGTIQYMSPEQIRGEPCDARADLYAMGCILYELLCGQAPFVGRSPAEVLSSHLMREPPPPSRLAPGLGPELDELVLRLLAKDRRRRLGHAGILASALEALGAEAGEAAPAEPWRAHLYRPALAGRARERARLRQGIRLESGTGAVILVGGESGIGKTRLLADLGREIEGLGATVLAGGCRPVGGEPLQALRRPLQAIADSCLEAGPEQAEKILGWGAQLLALYEPAFAGLGPRPASGSPPSPAAVTPLQLYTLLSRVLLRLARVRPMVLLLEDLQWADELSLGWLAHLLEHRWLERMPLFVVGTYRSEERGEGLRLLLDRDGVTRLELERLDASAVEALASDMLALEKLPAAFARKLEGLSEGNPLFVAEYLRAAVDQGLLRLDEDGRWGGAALEAGAAPGEAELPLPRSLRELLERRFEGLDAAARGLVAIAAVLGQEAEAALLGRASGLEAEPAASAQGELLRREVLVETSAGLLRFAHDRLREIAYEALSAAERGVLHRAAAEALAERLALGHEEALAELARHQELSGQPEAARGCFLRAARWAVKRGAAEDAERLYRSHLRLLDGISEHAVEVRNEMGLRLFHLQGRMERGRAEHRQALAEARQLGARRAEGHSLRLLGLIEYHTGNLDEAEALSAEALSIARETGEAWLEAATSNNLANLLNLRGRYDEAAQHAEAALALARRHGFEDLEATTLASLGMVFSNQGHLDQAEALYGEAVALLRRRGERDEEGVLLSNLGNLARMQGQLDKARTLHGEALQIQRQRGNLREEARILGNLAHVELEAGCLPEAESLGRRALALNRQIGNRRSESFVLDALAVVEILQGKVEAARKTLQQNLEARRSMNSGLREVSTLLDLAKLARHTEPDPGAACGRLEEVRALIDGAGDRWMMRAHWMCMMGHQELAEGRSAAAWIGHVRELEASSGYRPTIQLRKGTEALLGAQAAFEAGETERLYRGELIQDFPEGLLRWLVRNGRLSEAQAGLQPQAPQPAGKVVLELDWD